MRLSTRWEFRLNAAVQALKTSQMPHGLILLPWGRGREYVMHLPNGAEDMTIVQSAANDVIEIMEKRIVAEVIQLTMPALISGSL